MRFVPVRFTPRSSVFKDTECGGINIIITDRTRFHSVQAGLEIAVALRHLYPAEWKVEDYVRLLVNAETLEAIKRGGEPEAIMRLWAEGLNEFRRARSRALLYK